MSRTPGQEFKAVETEQKRNYVQQMRLQRLRKQWEERQAILLRGQQAKLKADFLARHPDLACPHDHQSGRLRLAGAELLGTLCCDDCGETTRDVSRSEYALDPRLAA